MIANVPYDPRASAANELMEPILDRLIRETERSDCGEPKAFEDVGSFKVLTHLRNSCPG